MCFCFPDDKQARDAYDSIRAWTCKIGKVDRLYAFTYQPQRPEKDVDGWGVYDPRAEWRRQGIGEKLGDKGWRLSHINKDYSVGRLAASVTGPRSRDSVPLVLSNISIPARRPFHHL